MNFNLFKKINVTLVSNEIDFPKRISTIENTTLKNFFNIYLNMCIDSYVIRIKTNNTTITGRNDYIIKDGDLISIVPKLVQAC